MLKQPCLKPIAFLELYPVLISLSFSSRVDERKLRGSYRRLTAYTSHVSEFCCTLTSVVDCDNGGFFSQNCKVKKILV